MGVVWVSRRNRARLPLHRPAAFVDFQRQRRLGQDGAVTQQHDLVRRTIAGADRFVAHSQASVARTVLVRMRSMRGAAV